MPPIVALWASLGFSFILLRRESKIRHGVSSAVWIPTLWMMLISSRAVSAWLSLQAPRGMDELMEGSPTDRLVFLGFILVALVILWHRRIVLGRVLSNNIWLVLFIAYCALSISWSDFPYVSFKRWFKSLGDPLMVLILLSEENASAAVLSALRRAAFVLIPLSIVFMKYFPLLGRGYDEWTGQAYYTGVTTNKNMLGYQLLVFGLLFICTLLSQWTRTTNATHSERTTRWTEAGIALMFLVMIEYLFRMADSKTPLVGLLIGCVVVVGLSVRFIRAYFGLVLTVSLIVGVFLQFAFNVSGGVISATGRDMTLTGRTDVWETVLSMTVNPVIGAGFESFWLGERLKAIWALYYFRPNQAHNGYLEVYINLGVIGLVFLTGVLLSSYGAVRQKLKEATDPKAVDDLILAKFGMSFWTAFLLYNVTEATFKNLTLLFVTFLMLAIRYPKQRSEATAVAWPKPFPSLAARQTAGAGGGGRLSPVLQQRPTQTTRPTARFPNAPTRANVGVGAAKLDRRGRGQA